MHAEVDKTQFERDFGRALIFLDSNRRKFMNDRLREYGLCGAMYMILLHVGRFPGTTQDAIVCRMRYDKSNVARRVKQLEELAYLRRETDPNDRRQNNLFLTPQGEQLVPVIEAALSAWAQGAVSSLSEEERESLHSLLTKTVESVAEQCR